MREADEMNQKKKIGRDALISVFVIVSFLTTAFILRSELNTKESPGLLTKISVCLALPYDGIEKIEKYISNRIDPQPDIKLNGEKDDSVLDEPDDPYSDISKAVKKAQTDYDAGLYPDKGKVIEKDMSETKATDTIGNVLIQNATDGERPDFEKMLDNFTSLKIEDKSKPSVLIYHTHTTECYKLLDNGVYSDKWQSRNSAPSLNMVRVGSEMTSVLTEMGFTVIHDENIYDKSYSGAYDRSLETVKKYLKEYPSIKVTLDVHRDAIYADNNERYKPTVNINGEKSAQVMIIAGREEGSITSFPNWEENLAFALALQKYVQNDFPSLMRPIFFARRQYNMDVTPYSLLLEFGTDANTLEEAVRSANHVASALGKLLEDCINEK